MLGIDHPIVLGPFGGLSSVELTAAVSELGGLGSFGLYGYDAGRIAEAAAAIRAATSRPFNLNVWLPLTDDPTDAPLAPGDFEASVDALRPFFDEVGAAGADRAARARTSRRSRSSGTPCSRRDPRWRASCSACRRPTWSRVRGHAASAWWARRRRSTRRSRSTRAAWTRSSRPGSRPAATGCRSCGSPSSRWSARSSLIPQVVDAVSVPVIAAGGIADRRGVAAALALGAAGVQVGTAFLRTRQSATNDAHRAAIGATAAHETVLTRAMSGRLARGARNRVVREIEDGGVIAPFPVQNWLTGKFRAEAIRQGRADLQSLWMGQSAPLAVHDDVRDVYAELAAGLPELRAGLGGAGGGYGEPGLGRARTRGSRARRLDVLPRRHASSGPSAATGSCRRRVTRYEPASTRANPTIVHTVTRSPSTTTPAMMATAGLT